MTGKQLKISILQWAIQGKLVPQDPSDEPASVLLERIRTEKVRLVKEGKIKKDKNESIIYRGEDNSHYEKIGSQVRCIDDEIPFELPNGWEWCRLGQIGTSQLGKTMDKAKNSGSPTSYLCSINVYWEGIDFANVKTALFTEEERKKYSLTDGDLLICEGGDVGRSAIWHGTKEMYYQNALHRVRFFGNLSTSFYLYTLMLYKLSGIIDNASTGMTIKHFTTAKLDGLLFPLPPLAEQHSIVAKLEQILPLVEKYGKEQDTLERLNADIKDLLKKSILQEAIQGKLVPQDPNDEPASELLKRIKAEKERLIKDKKIKRDKTESVIFRGDDNKYYETFGKNIVCIDEEIPFEIPDSWCWTRLAGIAELYTGDSINEEEKKLKFMTGTGRYYIGTKDVGFDHKINYKNGVQIPSIFEPVLRIAPKGSVLMCVEGGSAGRKIAILNETVCFGNKLCCFSPFGEYAMYIYYYLQSPAFFSIFSQNKTGIIGGVSLNTLKSLIIPLPPKQEINRIVQKIDELFAAIN